MQKMLKQGYIAPRLKSSLQKFYGRHHNLVDRYKIFIACVHPVSCVPNVDSVSGLSILDRPLDFLKHLLILW